MKLLLCIVVPLLLASERDASWIPNIEVDITPAYVPPPAQQSGVPEYYASPSRSGGLSSEGSSGLLSDGSSGSSGKSGQASHASSGGAGRSGYVSFGRSGSAGATGSKSSGTAGYKSSGRSGFMSSASGGRNTEIGSSGTTGRNYEIKSSGTTGYEAPGISWPLWHDTTDSEDDLYFPIQYEPSRGTSARESTASLYIPYDLLWDLIKPNAQEIVDQLVRSLQHTSSDVEIGDNEIGDNEIDDNEIGDNEIGDNEISSNEIGDYKIGDYVIKLDADVVDKIIIIMELLNTQLKETEMGNYMRRHFVALESITQQELSGILYKIKMDVSKGKDYPIETVSLNLWYRKWLGPDLEYQLSDLVINPKKVQGTPKGTTVAV